MTSEEVRKVINARIEPLFEQIEAVFQELEVKGMEVGLIFASGIRIDDQSQEDYLGLGGEGDIIWNALRDLVEQQPSVKGVLIRAVAMQKNEIPLPHPKCEA